MPTEPEKWGSLDWETQSQDQYHLALSRDQADDSGPCLGERFAMVVNCKTKPELAEMIERGGTEACEGLLEFLEAAEKSLTMRLNLVQCAFARLFVVGEILEDQGK